MLDTYRRTLFNNSIQVSCQCKQGCFPFVYHHLSILLPTINKLAIVFHPSRQLPGSLARIPPGFSDNAQVPCPSRSLTSWVFSSSGSWNCTWQHAIIKHVKPKKGMFPHLHGVCVWRLLNASSMSFQCSPGPHLSECDVFLDAGRRCTASWSWHLELTVQQPCFVNSPVKQGTDTEHAVFVSMCDHQLFVESHAVLECFALKNAGESVPLLIRCLHLFQLFALLCDPWRWLPWRA